MGAGARPFPLRPPVPFDSPTMAIAILGAHPLHAALAVLSAEREFPTALAWSGQEDPRHADPGEPELAERFE
jgi:hypothetical protein